MGIAEWQILILVEGHVCHWRKDHYRQNLQKKGQLLEIKSQRQCWSSHIECITKTPDSTENGKNP